MAIDRLSLEEAEALIREAGDAVDIVEVGTSLIKEFGIQRSVGDFKRRFPRLKLLADLKVMDEGAYEFQKTYEAGADLATVMGAAAPATIAACRDTARSFGREYMIDLLEVEEEKMRRLTVFEDAIFCLHLPSDLGGRGLEELVNRGRDILQGSARNVRIAAAGGIGLESIPLLKQAGVQVVVVGSAITKSSNVRGAATSFSQAVRSTPAPGGGSLPSGAL
jgi:3-hexulose-6-phosphate synthase